MLVGFAHDSFAIESRDLGRACDVEEGTMLDILGKSKDTDKAHMDLKDLNIRKELYLQWHGTKVFKLLACYSLTLDEQRDFCKFLKSI